MNKYESYLNELFNTEKNYLLGGEVKDKLIEKFNCKDSYARKLIELAVKSSIIQTNKEITFGKGQYLYWGKNYEISENIIRDKFRDTRPNIYRVLNRFEDNKGIISYFEIYKIAACTTEKTNSKITQFGDILEILNKLKNVQTIDDQGVKYIAEVNSEGRNINYMKNYYSSMKIECTFLPMVLVWLQKNNIIDSEDVLYRNKNTPCNGIVSSKLVWDACAFTGTVGFNDNIVNKEKDSKSFVFIDICITRDYTIDDLKGFYERLQIFRNSVKNNKRRIIPIIFSSNISKEIKKEIKKLNILCFDIKVIFGDKIVHILDDLKIISFSDIYGEKFKDYNDVTDIIANSLETLAITGQEENLQNLKGVFFEALMYKVFAKIFKGSIIRQNYVLNYTENGERYTFEYDYIIETDDEKIICELKGRKKDNIIKLGKFVEDKKRPEKYTIKWFFSHTLNKALEKLHDSDRKIRACYITTGKIENAAIEKMNMMNKFKSSKLDVYYDREKLIKLLIENNCDNEVSLIKRYYK
ncbi:hypothetical protein CSC2_06420 [Clostridium zeae]|uniref:Uncharacterized protein n=1 Tax=Clostridium zeae TaxID=2759022 RepID=A0ABQ1E5V5_9CLOT|nr:hypothetical protein [Clostridium zeae]GFZ30116.1 hypothetical protein CSC2_06420 [Clostridium zeae]